MDIPSLRNDQLHLAAAMRLSEIKRRPYRNYARGIYLMVRDVIVSFDVIEVHCLGNAGQLIEVQQVTLQIRVVDDAPDVAFEVPVIDRIEADECAKQPPIRFHNTAVE